ncbi:DUF3016 domain-containing protein [Colwellia sp. TT2012]|uniref:DUF3016 domain-containing protein n=1 Tax=Colwellia sp. TT2012 TaxID=1720342 RepID=UPI00070B8633|nr:DUF3016 domain-containing protein [Colwellia sp. TT2012]
MKQFIYMVTLLILTSLMAPGAFAASSEVTWTDYKSYRDINAGNENRKSFRERIFRDFEKHFAKLAATLPEGQVLKIDVTDVDLAGDTHAAGIHRTRIVKQIYRPRMNFSYQLFDADGKLVQSDEVVVKDMNFMSGSNLKYRHKSLGYEKKMLDDWFDKAFKDLRVKK